MSDLTDFLLARIAEDAAAARRESLTADYGDFAGFEWWELEDGGPVLVVQPARVLAECEAKRDLIAYVTAPAWGAHPLADATLRALALPYADHSDYREEWGM